MSEQNTETIEPEGQVTDETTDADTTDAPEADEDDSADWRKNFDPDKAAARITKLQSEAKNLRERAKKAEEKANGVDEKDQTISKLERTTLRYEVAFDLGLPKELAMRLQGDSKEEMLADAEQLVRLVGSPKPTQQRKPVEALRGGGQPEQEPEETDTRKIGERMFRH